MNVECDLLAKHACVAFASYPNLTYSRHLPFETVSLWYNDTKLYKNYFQHVQETSTFSDTYTYYCRKYSITPYIFSTINWNAVGSAMEMCNPSTAKMISKLSCGFIGVARTLARREYWLDDKCPCCHIHSENNTHLWTCPHLPSRQKIHLLLSDLSGWLETVSTVPDLRRGIIDTTTLWIDDPSLQHYHPLVEPISSQLTIGWSHFMFGRISIGITNYQHQYYTSIGSRREAQSWTHKLITKLWTTIICLIWQYRNKFVHGLEPSTTSRLYSDIKTMCGSFLLYQP